MTGFLFTGVEIRSVRENYFSTLRKLSPMIPFDIMIELLRYRDIAKVTYYRSLLENAGIRTFIRNENLSTTEGVSIPDFYPALCILNGDDQEHAMALINEDMQDEELACGEVVCKDCQESSPANFGTCWNCGAVLPAQ